MSEQLTSELVSKLLRERFPPKMIEINGKSVPDSTDPQFVFNSVLISLVRRAEMSEKRVTVLEAQMNELLKAIQQAMQGGGQQEQQEMPQPPTSAQQAAPPPPQAVEEETEEEEGPPVPNVRANQVTSVVPNTPAPNGRS